MLFINGKFPGPLIEANRGDRLVINVTNNLKANATSMHWHGMFQNGTNWFDGTTGRVPHDAPIIVNRGFQANSPHRDHAMRDSSGNLAGVQLHF